MLEKVTKTKTRGRGTGNGRGIGLGFKPSCETVCWGDEYAHPEFPDKAV